MAVISTTVKAVPSSFFFNGDMYGEFATTVVEGYWIMCIKGGATLKQTTYYGNEEGKVLGSYHTYTDGKVDPEWLGVKYQSKYTLDREIPYTQHQAAAYVLIHAADIQNGKLPIDNAQNLIWWYTDINEGKIKGEADLGPRPPQLHE